MSDNKNQAQPIFIAILKSGKQFLGGNNYFNTKWTEISEPIERLYCRLPDGNFLMLCNYEKYNFLVEGTQDFSFPKGQSLGGIKVEYIYAMGKKGNKVDSYRITIFEKKNERYRIGDITKRTYEFGKELRNGSTRGWK